MRLLRVSSISQRVIVAALALLLSVPANAHNEALVVVGTPPTCTPPLVLTHYTESYGGLQLSNDAAVVARANAWLSSYASAYTHSNGTLTWTGTGANLNVTGGNTQHNNASFSTSYTRVCGQPFCQAGLKQVGTGEFLNGAVPPISVCEGGCFKTRTFFGVDYQLVGKEGAPQVYTYEYESTGGNCSEETEVGDTPLQNGCATSASGASVCKTTPGCGTVNGEEVCAATGNQQCGTVNGEAVCITPGVEDSACVTTEGGQAFCVADYSETTNVVPSPPAPDNGTEGQPAQPDVVMAPTNTGTGTAGIVYSSTTVTNSTNYGDGGETPPGEGFDGDIDCGGSGEPACKVQIQGMDGNGGTFAAPVLEETEEIGDALTSYRERLEAAPIVAAFGGLADAMPSGQGVCPTVTFNVFGQALPLDSHCPLFEEIRGMLSWVMLLTYGLVGVRIVLSA